MLTEIAVENTVISGFKRINMIAGHPDNINALLYGIRGIEYAIRCSYTVASDGIKGMSLQIFPDVASEIHFSDISDVLLRILNHNQDSQLFLTTQRYDVIQGYYDVLMCNPDYADDCTFMRIGRSALDDNRGQITATHFDQEKLGRFLKTNMEVR